MTLPSAPNIPNARITTRIFRSRISDFPISDFRMILIRFSSIGSTPTFLYFELYFTYNTFIRFFIHFIRFSRRRAYARNVRHRFLYWHSTNFQYHFHNSIGISALPTQQNTFFALLRYKTLDTPNKVMILISGAAFKCRYRNNGYSYDSKISRLVLEIHCQYGQKQCWESIG